MSDSSRPSGDASPVATGAGGERSDEELIAAVRKGEADAWRDLVERYERLVMSVPRRLGLSREDAEEVFQCTWRTLYQHLGSIREPGRISFWVRTTARREAWRLGQAKRIETLADVELDVLPSSDQDGLQDQADQLGRRESESAVLAALESLDPRCRDLLTRLFLDPESPSYSELSAQLDLPIGSIGPTRIRCLEKLAQQLGASDLPDSR